MNVNSLRSSRKITIFLFLWMMIIALVIIDGGMAVMGVGAQSNTPEPQKIENPNAVSPKFRPGIYVFYDRANLNPATVPITGGHMAFEWDTIELAPGRYDWSRVDQWLAKEASYNKPAIVGFLSYNARCCGGDEVPQFLYQQHPDMQVICEDSWRIPKYWSDAYLSELKQFITEAGKRYDGDPRISFIEIDVGNYGETKPADGYHHDCLADAGLDRRLWTSTVNRIVDIHRRAFRRTPLVLQYAPVFESISERRAFTDYAASHGVGLKHNGLAPDADAANINDPNYSLYGAGQYDPMYKWWKKVPIGWESYEAQFMTGPTNTMWGVYNGLDKHADYFVLSRDLVDKPEREKILRFALAHLGKTVDDSPSAWVAMRETEYSWYPQFGNYDFFMEQNDAAPGGRTVPLWNVSNHSEGRYTRRTDIATGNPYMYFDIEDDYLFDIHERVRLNITYYDKGTDSFEVHYDAWSDANKLAGVVRKSDSGQWKTVSWELTDARFGNRQPGGGRHPGSDLNIYARSDGDEIIHLVQVERLDLPPGPGATATPIFHPHPTPTWTPEPDGLRRKIIYQQGVDGYQGATDTYINSWSEDSNYGASSILRSRSSNAQQALLKFDRISLPAGVALDKALLQIYVQSRSNDAKFYVRTLDMKTSWEENSATWNRASSSRKWRRKHFGPSDYATPYTDFQFLTGIGQWVELDVTEVVRRWLADPSSNRGLLLDVYSIANIAIDFPSSENRDVSLRPRLILEYLSDEVGVSTATPTPASSATPTPSPTFSPTATPTPKPVTISRRPVADTHFSQWRPYQNFGAEEIIAIRSSNVSDAFIRFDLSDIPAGSRILDARLHLHRIAATNANTLKISVQRANRAWTESGLTWNDASKDQPWTGGGASAIPADRGDKTYATQIINQDTTDFSLDVTDLVREWVEQGVQNQGLILHGDSWGQVRYSLASREAANAGQRPFLTIAYLPYSGPPTPTATPYPTATPTATFTPRPTATPTPRPTATFTPAPTVPPGESAEVTLSSLADAYTDQWHPNDNYGGLTLFRVRSGDIKQGLIQFDLERIPTNVIVDEAILHLWVLGRSNANYLTINLYALKRPWQELQVTHNRADSNAAWQTSGAHGDADRYPEIIDSLQLPENGPISLNVTAAVRRWVADPALNHGLIIGGSSWGSVYYNFASRENSVAEQRPRLTIRYHLPPTPTPTPTSTPTFTPTPTPTFTPTPLAIPTSTPGAPKRINADFGSVVIDGDFSDWGASFMALDTGSAFYIRHPEAISGPADTSVLIQARWDETHLYFAFDVRDEQMIVDSSDIWKDDGIEIGLDGENDNDAWSSSGGDHQFTIRFDGQAADRTLAIHNPDVKWAVQRTDIGYRVEMAAPLEELGVDSLFSGQVLGVDFAVNDDDDGGERDSQLNWASTTTYSDASGFGDLVLSGGPSSSTATSTPIPTSTPGASKRIRAQRGSAEIDGDLQEWTEPSMSLDTGSAQRVDSPEAIDSPADSSALIWARWDDDFIYLAFDVRDDVIKTDSRNLWKDDSIEIGVDGEDDDEAWSSSGGDHQFTIRSDGQAADRTLAIGAKDVKWAVKANEHGYQAEIAIPLSALGVDRLTAGQQIGIDFAINDDDSGGYRDSQLVWSSLSTYSDAPGFGVLILY